MQSHDRTSRLLATMLSMLAGYIDALGFLSLGGYFVSFMSGNSTRLAVGIIEDIPWLLALTPLGIIALFVGGVILGRFVRHFSKDHPSSAVLFMMSFLLLLAATSVSLSSTLIAAPLMAIAMGSANNIFMREGEVSIGVTYMTGTLVKMGQRIAGCLLGERNSQWFPYFLLWLGLVSGAILGAVGYSWIGLYALWLAFLFCVILAITARSIEEAHGS